MVLQRGGSVSVAVPALPRNLNPYTAAGANQVTAEVAAQIWPSVFVTGPGGSEVANTTLVTSAEVVGVPPSGPFTVQYVINPEASWSDGVPITAADFVYLWHALRDDHALSGIVPVRGYADITSVVGSAGGRTVTVTFATPYADWTSLFDGLLPSHLAATGAPFSSVFASTSVSGGPFRVGSVQPGAEMTLVRNPAWWGTPARLDAIHLKVMRGSSTILRALQVGSVQLAELPPSLGLNAAVAASSDLAAQPEETSQLWQLVFDQADPLLSQPSVRRAVADAIDRRELLWDTVGLADPAASLAGDHLVAEGMSGAGSNGGAYQVGNDATADSLLAGAGYVRDAAGMLESASGAPLRLRLVAPSGSALVRQIEALLRVQLLDAGIALVVQNVPPARLLGHVLPAGEFQLALVPYLLSPFSSENVALYSSPVGTTSPLVVDSPGGAVLTPSAGASLDGGAAAVPTEPGAAVIGAVTRNIAGFVDRSVTARALEAFGQLNPAKAGALYNGIDVKLWNDLVTLPLFQTPLDLVANDRLVNASYAPTWAGPFWDAAQWGLQVSPPPTTTTTIP